VRVKNAEDSAKYIERIGNVDSTDDT